MNVHALTEASQKTVDEINALLVQLRNGEASHGTLEQLQNIVKNPNMALVVAEDNGRIVGMGMAYVWQKVGREKGFVEDVVVDESARGHGLGTKIMNELIAFARSRGAGGLVLTSNFERKAAHALYEKLGFKKQDTNFYKLKF